MHVFPLFYRPLAGVTPILGYHDIPSMHPPCYFPKSHVLSENHTHKLLLALCYCRFQPRGKNGKKVTLIRSKYRFYLYLVNCLYRFIPTLRQINPYSIHPIYFAMNHFNIMSQISLGVQDFLPTLCIHRSSIPSVLHAPPILSST
jgi:hypothetical protein